MKQTTEALQDLCEKLGGSCNEEINTIPDCIDAITEAIVANGNHLIVEHNDNTVTIRMI